MQMLLQMLSSLQKENQQKSSHRPTKQTKVKEKTTQVYKQNQQNLQKSKGKPTKV